MFLSSRFHGSLNFSPLIQRREQLQRWVFDELGRSGLIYLVLHFFVPSWHVKSVNIRSFLNSINYSAFLHYNKMGLFISINPEKKLS